MEKIKIAIVFSVIIFVITGCISCNQQSKPPKEILKIGAIVPLTGNLGFLGESAKKGLDFASFYFSKIDSTRKVEFFLEDGQGNPTNSINALNKLVNVEKINIVFSTISAVELSLVPIQKKDSFLFISHSSHPKLSNVNNLVFRHSPTVAQEVELISTKIDSEDKVTICYMMDDYGVSFESSIKTSAKARTITSISFQKGETNFNPIAQKIVESKPNKIILCAGGSNLNSLIQKLRELNCNTQVITTLAFTVSGAAKNIGNITNVSMVNFKPLFAQSEYAKYLSEYEKSNGTKLGTAELLFFNSALLIYKCSATSTNVQSIAKQIKNKQEWELLGETAKISTSNDILPNLEFTEK